MTLDSRRGRIVPPDLDDRTWQDLVDEMRRLIPQYAPGWTDHNPSDLGITLIELFAWLAEGVIYRLNRTPEKHYLSFLELLGVTRDPPRPATTYLTFTAGEAAVDVPAGTQAQTAAVSGGTPVVFETDEDVRVVPTSLRSAVIVGPHATGAASATYDDVTAALAGSPATKHLVTVPPSQVVELCFGFDRKVTTELALRLRLYQPAGATPPTVTFLCSRATTGPLAWTPVAGAVDGTEALRHDGTVRLTPPADWAAQRPTLGPGDPPPPWAAVTVREGTRAVTDLRFWIAARLVNPSTTAPVVVGIDRVLFNAARASTALTIRAPEELGESTGAPFQSFLLQNRPLHRRPGPDPYGHLVVEVGQGTPTVWEAWTPADDLPAGPGKVHRVHPVTGEVMFGNHDSRPGATGSAGGDVAHGSIPPAGSRVRARSYRYVASGSRGNVAADQVTSPGTSPAGGTLSGLTVTNLGPGFDGTDEEPIEEALRRAPEELKIRDRAVTADDYEFLAREAADLHIVRCLPARLHLVDGPANTWKKNDPWNFAGLLRAPGQVHVVIVPDLGPTVARPEPTPALRSVVQDHLDARRDLGASLAVVGPRYLPVAVKVDLVVWKQAVDAGAAEDAVRAETLAKVHAFLHPTAGGPTGDGWQVGQGLSAADVFRAVRPADEIGYLAGVQVKPVKPPLYHLPPLNPTGTADNWGPTSRPFALPADFGTSVRVADYELVCSADSAAHQILATVQLG
jgi:predicted phage baseplate assembly protein